jgi:hypothetical protein
MSKIVKVVPLAHEITDSRANGLYGNTAFAVHWLYTAANYDPTPAVYFEAILAVTGGSGTAYASLYTAGGSAVTGGEVSTTSGTPTRVRTADLLANLVDGTEYRYRLKSTDGTVTCTVYMARLVIVQNGTIVATETVVDFGSSFSFANTSYATDTTKTQVMLVDKDQYDGTVACYFEASLSTTSGTVNAQLAKSDGTDITGTELSHNTSTDTRKRSGDIWGNITDGDTHLVEIKTSAGTGRCRHARLVIVQTGTPTKTETFYQIETSLRPNVGTTRVVGNGDILWDADEWSVSSYSVFHEAHFDSNAGGSTFNCSLNDGTNDDDTRNTTSATLVRSRSGALTLTDSDQLDAEFYLSSGSSSGTNAYMSMLVIQATLSGGTTTINLAAAALSASGQALDVQPGAVSKALNAAALSASGQQLSVAAVYTAALSAAALSAAGQALDVQPGASTTALSVAALSAAGQPLSVQAVYTAALAAAALSAAGQALTVQPGAISRNLSAALLSAVGQALTVTAGGEILLSAAALTAAGQALTVAPGASSTALAAALLTAAGQALTVDAPGISPTTVQLAAALLSLLGQPLTIEGGTPASAADYVVGHHVLRTFIDLFDPSVLVQEAWVRRLKREEEELLWLLLNG